MKKTVHSRSRGYLTTAESPPPSVFVQPQSKQRVKRPKVMMSSRSSRPDPYILHTEPKVGKQPTSPQFTQQNNNRVHTSFSKIRPTSFSLTRESVPLLRERLSNVRQHYESMIQEVKKKSDERNQMILGLIEEMQMTHTRKVDQLRRMIEEAEDEKKNNGLVGEKMSEIKRNIEGLILQSNNLKRKNEELTKQIRAKFIKNQSKQEQLQTISKQVLETREEIQQYQLNNLKNKRINKEIMQMFNIVSTVSSKN